MIRDICCTFPFGIYLNEILRRKCYYIIYTVVFLLLLQILECFLPPPSHLTSVWLWRSQTTMFPSLQQEKQTLLSGEMARA